MSFHVASDAEGLATSGLGALVWLLACVAVAVDPETARAGEGFIASGADVAILRLRKRRLT